MPKKIYKSQLYQLNSKETLMCPRSNFYSEREMEIQRLQFEIYSIQKEMVERRRDEGLSDWTKISPTKRGNELRKLQYDIFTIMENMEKEQK